MRDRGNETKAYICLFTCGLSRAFHLEVVRDLSVDTFMQAFCKFAARKSLPRLLLSDNASTYVSAAKELEQLFSSEGILNDCPLTYLSADISDPDPLTPSHLLYGRRIMSLPYTTVEDSEIGDPTFLPSSALQERVKRQTQILQHFQQ